MGGHVKTKLRRRRVKREGPPQLQFLIATDPSQFRDEDTRRSVRSQAMMHWRHETDKKKRKDSQPDGLSTSSTGKGTTRDASVRSAGSSRWQLTAPETASYFPQYRKQTQAITDKAVTDYEETERHEARQLRTMVVGLATFYNVVGSHDPFEVLPQFRNPNLDALYLSRSCKSAPSIPRVNADVFRYACVFFCFDYEEMATTTAVAPTHYPQFHSSGVELA
jgi:hypothetical protein